MQACLKEIHAKLLRKHLHRLEQPLQDENVKSEEEKIEEEESEEEVKGMSYSLSMVVVFLFKTEEHLFEHSYLNRVVCLDARAFSPEPIITHEEAQESEAEDGSFSPQLLHSEDTEEAIDPEEDRVILVS